MEFLLTSESKYSLVLYKVGNKGKRHSICGTLCDICFPHTLSHYFPNKT